MLVTFEVALRQSRVRQFLLCVLYIEYAILDCVFNNESFDVDVLVLSEAVKPIDGLEKHLCSNWMNENECVIYSGGERLLAYLNLGSIVPGQIQVDAAVGVHQVQSDSPAFQTDDHDTVRGVLFEPLDHVIAGFLGHLSVKTQDVDSFSFEQLLHDCLPDYVRVD